MDGTLDGNTGNATSTGPTTFAEAFAADASSAPDSSSQPIDAAAAEQPAAEGVTPVEDDKRSPYITRSRFDEVNGKYNELKQWKEQHGWVEGVDRSVIDQAVQIGQRYQQDPMGYARQLLSEIAADPQHGPALRSELARMLGTRQQQAAPMPAAVDLNPIPVQLEDGRTVPLFSADQARAMVEQELGKLRQEFEPALQTTQELKQREAHAAQVAEADRVAGDFLADIRKFPDFKALEPEIKQRLRTYQFRSANPEEVQAATYRIFLELSAQRKTADIAKAQSSQLDSLRRQAAASVSPNPGSAAATTVKSPKSFSDPSLVW